MIKYLLLTAALPLLLISCSDASESVAYQAAEKFIVLENATEHDRRKYGYHNYVFDIKVTEKPKKVKELKERGSNDCKMRLYALDLTTKHDIHVIKNFSDPFSTFSIGGYGKLDPFKAGKIQNSDKKYFTKALPKSSKVNSSHGIAVVTCKTNINGKEMYEVIKTGFGKI